MNRQSSSRRGGFTRLRATVQKVALTQKAVHTYSNFVRAKKGVKHGPHDLEDHSPSNSSGAKTATQATAPAAVSRLAHRRHVPLERVASSPTVLGLPA